MTSRPRFGTINEPFKRKPAPIKPMATPRRWWLRRVAALLLDSVIGGALLGLAFGVIMVVWLL